MNIFSVFFTLFLAYIFLFSAISKMQNYSMHREIVESYQILPKILISITTLFFIIAEVMASILIIFHTAFLNIAIITLITLTLIYSLAILVNLIRGRRDLSCGCGGVLGDHDLSYKLIVRNGLIVLCLLFASFIPIYNLPFIVYLLANILIISALCLFLIFSEIKKFNTNVKELLQ